MKLIESSPQTMSAKEAIELLKGNSVTDIEISSRKYQSILHFKINNVKATLSKEFIKISDGKNSIDIEIASLSKYTYNDGYKMLVLDTKGEMSYTLELK